MIPEGLLEQINRMWKEQGKSTADKLSVTAAIVINNLLKKLLTEGLVQQDKVSNLDIEAIIGQLPIELGKNLAGHIWQYSEEYPLIKGRLIVIANQLASQLAKSGSQDNPYSEIASKIIEKDLERKKEKEEQKKNIEEGLQEYKKKVQGLLHEYQTHSTKKADDFTKEFNALAHSGGVFIKANPQVAGQFLSFLKELKADVRTINAKVKEDGIPDWDMGGKVEGLFVIAEDARKKCLPVLTLLDEILEKARKRNEGWGQDFENYMLKSGDEIAQGGEALRVIKKIIKVSSNVKSSVDREALANYVEYTLLPAFQRASDKNPVEMLQVAQKLHPYFAAAAKKDVFNDTGKNTNLDFVISMLNKAKNNEKVIKMAGKIFSKDKKFAQAIVARVQENHLSIVKNSPLARCLEGSLTSSVNQSVPSTASKESKDNFIDYQNRVNKLFKDYTAENHQTFIIDLEGLAKEGENILNRDLNQADNFLKLIQSMSKKASKIDKYLEKNKRILHSGKNCVGIVKDFESNIQKIRVENLPLVVLQRMLKSMKQRNWKGDLREPVESAVRKGEEAAAVDMIVEKIASSKSWVDETLRSILFQQLDTIIEKHSKLDSVFYLKFNDPTLDSQLIKRKKERVSLLFKIANAKVESGNSELQESAIENYKMIFSLSDDNNQKAKASFEIAELLIRGQGSKENRVKLYEKALELSDNLAFRLQIVEKLYQLNENVVDRERYIDIFINHMKDINYDSRNAQIVREKFMLLQDKEFRHVVAQRMMARFNRVDDMLNVPALLQNKNNFLVKFLGTPTSLLGLGKRFGIETKSMGILKEATLEKLLINMNDEGWSENGKDAVLWGNVLFSLVLQNRAQEAAEKIIHKLVSVNDFNRRHALSGYLENIIDLCQANEQTQDCAAIAFKLAKLKEQFDSYGKKSVTDCYEIARDNSADNLVLSLEAAKNLYFCYSRYSHDDQKEPISDIKKDLDHVINLLRNTKYDAHGPIVKQVLTTLNNDVFRQALVSRIIQRCADPDDSLNWETFKTTDNLLVRCFRDENPIQKLHAILKRIGKDTDWRKELNENFAENLIDKEQAALAVREIMKKLGTSISSADKLFLVDFMEEKLYDYSIGKDNNISRQIFLKKSELEFELQASGELTIKREPIIEACLGKYNETTSLDFQVKILELLYRSDPDKAQTYVNYFIELTQPKVHKDKSERMPLLTDSNFKQAIANRKHEIQWDSELKGLISEKKAEDAAKKIIDKLDHVTDSSKRFALLESLDNIMLECHAQENYTAYAAVAFRIAKVREKLSDEKVDKYYQIARDMSGDNLILLLQAAGNLHSYIRLHEGEFEEKNENINLDHVIDRLINKDYEAGNAIIKQALSILKSGTFRQALAERIVARCVDPKDSMDLSIFNRPNGLVVLFGNEPSVKHARRRYEDPIQLLRAVLKRERNLTDFSVREDLNEDYAKKLIEAKQGDLAVKEIMKKLSTPVSPHAPEFHASDEQYLKNFLRTLVNEYKEKLTKDTTDLSFKIEILEQLYRLDSINAKKYVDSFIDLIKDKDYKKDTPEKMPLLKDSEFRRDIARQMVKRFETDSSDINLPYLLMDKKNENNLLIKILEEATSKLKISSRFKFAGAKTGSIKILYDGLKEYFAKQGNIARKTLAELKKNKPKPSIFRPRSASFSIGSDKDKTTLKIRSELQPFVKEEEKSKSSLLKIFKEKRSDSLGGGDNKKTSNTTVDDIAVLYQSQRKKTN